MCRCSALVIVRFSNPHMEDLVSMLVVMIYAKISERVKQIRVHIKLQKCGKVPPSTVTWGLREVPGVVDGETKTNLKS